ncbi:MAG: Putative phage-associated protein [Candidatus Tokpelaia hoelldobleri]|uniref:Phage-associated protein n=1 Tax=Candidatus Tokpelaia hoelldobleri TaxID=1902579 RepID=A0A1U9JVF7_9HYPH|nr:MAG: Putative phage-associated protein [Candidatus Tokpelaia hoelldoblerii]
MSVSVFSAAKHLAERSGYSLSNLKMQKILYLAHMFYMGENEGKPLISDRFEAWDYGPVNPELYHELKIYGAEPVGNIFRQYPDLPEGEERSAIDVVCDTLRNVSAGKLVAATHQRDGAWEKHYLQGIKGRVIPNEDILQEYRERFGGNG